MIELWIYTYDGHGDEERHIWKFTPVDMQPGFLVLRDEKDRATGVKGSGAFSIQESWQITIGAGTMAVSEDLFIRLLMSRRIVWNRSRTVRPEFVLDLESDVAFDYLNNRRALKRKTVTLVEKQPHYYDELNGFLETYRSYVSSLGLSLVNL